MDEIIGAHLPALMAALGTDEVWFIRYRNREETDHLRVRVAAGHGQASRRAAALAAWAGDLRARRLCARVALDTYYPEAGRYGDGEAMRAAEAVFAADSAVVIAQLRQPPGTDPVALTALGMLDIAAAFSGGPDQGAQWLAGRRLQPGKTADHATARTASTLARNGEMSSFGTLPDDLAPAWLGAPRPWRPTARPWTRTRTSPTSWNPSCTSTTTATGGSTATAREPAAGSPARPPSPGAPPASRRPRDQHERNAGRVAPGPGTRSRRHRARPHRRRAPHRAPPPRHRTLGQGHDSRPRDR